MVRGDAEIARATAPSVGVVTLPEMVVWVHDRLAPRTYRPERPTGTKGVSKAILSESSRQRLNGDLYLTPLPDFLLTYKYFG